MDLSNVIRIIELALGFGFVIFWHELGHFAAAKWAGVKVEQFAVGFGTAALAWRKGIGFRIGSTRKEYEQRTREYLASVAAGSKAAEQLDAAVTDDQRTDIAGQVLGLGETEYRLNWLPLGGYVKMLGQDDLTANAEQNDPRAYNMQPIPKRMVIVSAGVVMNIFLAAIGFFILFLYGFNAPPAMVGNVLPGSPAQMAGLEVGDRILRLDGTEQHDFTKIVTSVALLGQGENVPIEVQRPNGEIQTLSIRAEKQQGDTRGVLALGVEPMYRLAGPDLKSKDADEDDEIDPKLVAPGLLKIRAGDVITHVNGQPVDVESDAKRSTDAERKAALAAQVFDRALQTSAGKPVEVTVRNTAGQSRTETLQPTFVVPFGKDGVSYAGMVPGTVIQQLTKDSAVLGKIEPGDVIKSLSIEGTSDTRQYPSRHALTDMTRTAGDQNKQINIVVDRDGKEIHVDKVSATVKLKESGSRGIGVGPWPDEQHAVIGEIERDSAAARAGIPQAAKIVSIDGQPVQSWFDVHRILSAAGKPADDKVAPSTAAITTKPAVATAARTFSVAYTQLDGAPNAKPAVVDLTLSPEEIATLKSYRLAYRGSLATLTGIRHTTNPLVAARWGLEETRDLILQFYLTIKRMTQGSVPANNLMGPYGIAKAGAAFASRGMDWLIWFLSMISANLAVVNFLPIPIVDGGLFVFLVIEKLQGRPVSPRTQTIAQVVGLALIVSVFIFVTYQDIMR